MFAAFVTFKHVLYYTPTLLCCLEKYAHWLLEDRVCAPCPSCPHVCGMSVPPLVRTLTRVYLPNLVHESAVSSGTSYVSELVSGTHA